MGKKWYKGKELLQLGQIVTYGNGKADNKIKKEVVEAIENFNGGRKDNKGYWSEEILPF